MSTTEAVDAFLVKLTELGDKLVDAAEPALRTATDAALTAVHFKGVVWTAAGCFLAVVMFAFAVSGILLIRAGERCETAREQEPFFFFGVGGVVIAIFSLMGSLTFLFSASTWMALFRPDAYLAAQVLGL